MVFPLPYFGFTVFIGEFAAGRGTPFPPELHFPMKSRVPAVDWVGRKRKLLPPLPLAWG